MRTAILRAVQIGGALLVTSAALLATLVVTGVLSPDSGLEIGLEVAAVIGVCMLAGIVLASLLGAGRGPT